MQPQLTAVKEDVLTEQQSQTYIRNLLRAAISSILYLRGVFDEMYFVDKNLCGINIKTLVPRDGDACTLTQWVEMGVFDALKQKYLRTIIFNIYSSLDDVNGLIESYNFNINYHEKKSVDISIDHHSLSQSSVGHPSSIYPTKSHIKNATTTLLRRLLSLTQTLPPLPSKRHMMMRLLYYRDITPMDYSPPFFMTCVVESPAGMQNLENIQIGNVQTPFHTITFSLSSRSEVETCSQQVPHLSQTESECSAYLTTSQATDEGFSAASTHYSHHRQLPDSNCSVRPHLTSNPVNVSVGGECGASQSTQKSVTSSQVAQSECLRSLLNRESYITNKMILSELSQYGSITSQEVARIIKELKRLGKIGNSVRGKGYPVWR